VKPLEYQDMHNDILHFYRQARSTNGEYSVGPGRIHVDEQFFRTATQAYYSAVGHIAFRKDLAATVKQIKKRSRTAKRGWKTRRAAA
jgi:hypothetical protein